MRIKACVIAALLGLPAFASAQDLPPLGTPEASQEDFPDTDEEVEEPEEETPTEREESAETTRRAGSADSAEPAEDAQATPGEETEAGVKKTTTVRRPAEEEEGDPRLVAAGLNLEGTVGMQHVAAAWGGNAHTYRVALMTEFYSGSDTVRFNDVDTLVVGNLLIEATPIQYFSANLRLQTRNNVNTFGRPQAMLSQGDALLGLKGNYPVADGLYLGGDLTLDFPTDFGTTGLNLAGTSVRPRVLFSFDGSELEAGVPLKGHLNVGYRVDNTENLIPDGIEATRVERFAYGLSAYDFFELGIGFMYDLPYVSPFLSWNLAVPVAGGDEICAQQNLPCAADAGFASYPNKFSLGLKSEPVDHLGLHAGIDLGVTSTDAAGLPVTPPWTVVFGASWTIDPTPKIEYVETIVEKEPEGPGPQSFVTATVIDAETQEPIQGAIVTYPGMDTPQASTESGTFRSYPFQPGSAVALTVTHPDYKLADVETSTPEVEGEEELITIELEPLAKSGIISGKVEDEAGAPVEGASVKISGGDEPHRPLTNSLGEFEQEVKEGEYTIAVSAENYLTSGRDVEVEADQKVDVIVVMKPEPEEELVQLRDDKIEIQQKIYFESGKATILPRSFGVLDQVASVMIQNPHVEKVAIEGHTDDVGSDDFNMELSQSRAESVRTYLMESGVSPERLTARGYGETRPVLPNTSKRNRSFNRRVEFNIVKE